MNEPLLISTNEAARLLSMSRAKLYEGLSSGTIGPMGFKIGGKRLFDPEELRSWVRSGCPGRRQWLTMKGGVRE